VHYASYLAIRPYLNEAQLWGLLVASVYLLALVWIRYHTYVAIDADAYLNNAGARNFWTDRISIHDIKYIARGGSWAGYWGSLVIFFGEAGWLTFVREKAYDDSTIRALLLELQHLKPGIKLDPDYEKFLQDQENDGMWLSQNPATRTVTEVERDMKPRA
jgi:hypothetical protein